MKNLFRYIGWRHIRIKPIRTLLTLVGVALGIALYVAIAIINHSTQNSMRESIESVAGKAKITISAGVTGFDESKLEVVRSVEGVRAAVPMIEARAFFQGAVESADGLYILGVDLLQEQSVRTYQAADDPDSQQIMDDPLIFLNQADSIILTQAIAKKRNLTINSKIDLATADGVKTFTVRGLLEPDGAARAYGGALAIMDIDGARVSFGKENKIDRIDIVPSDRIEIEKLRENLATTLGPGFKVETPEAQSSQMESMLGTYQMILTFFSTIALLVGLFLIVNSISVSVAERRREIGTLRALGATRRSMVALFVSEVIGIGLFGSILGCLLGRFLAELLVTQVTQSIVAQFQTQIQVTNLEFTATQSILAVVFGTLASVVAAFWPSLRAASVHPLESMRTHVETRTQEQPQSAFRMMFWGLAMLAYSVIAAIFEWGQIWFGFDLLGKMGAVLGTALFGPFLVFGALKISRPLIKKWTLLRIAQENLLRSPRRTASNLMALLVGLFMVMLIATVRTSFHDTLIAWFDRIFVADMLIASNGRMITADVQPLKEEVAQAVLGVSGIRKPTRPDEGMAYRLIRTEFNGKKITIKAFDQLPAWYESRNLAAVNADRKVLAKRLHQSKENVLLASDSFLLKQNKKENDTIVLNTPTGPVDFKIVGTIIDFASPDGVFYMDRQIYKKHWKDSLVTAFFADVEPGFTLEKVRSEVDRTIGKKFNVVVISNAEFRGQMESAVDRSFAYTRAIEWIALLVGLLGLLNTMLISVMERTREIGMLRAIGSTRSQIIRIILTEAGLQGLFGAIVAAILGAFIGFIFVRFSLATNLGWLMDFHFAGMTVVTTIVTGILVSVIAGLIPAQRAANLTITEALTYE